MRLVQRLKEYLYHYSWDLAFFEFDGSILYKNGNLANFHRVKNPYKNKWFADPFILSNSDKEILLLVEEFDYSIGRGRIASIAINRKTWTIMRCDILLDLPTHLSFPAIYRIGDEFYVHPENSASGTSIIYKYSSARLNLEPIKVIVNKPLTDAVMFNYRDSEYILTTEVPESNGSYLKIYRQNKEGEFRYFKSITITSHARMGGHMILLESQWIRPSQDCDGDYGKCIIFQELVEENGAFNFKDIGRLLPPNGYQGLHTFNTFNNELAVVDLKRYDFPLIYKLNNMIRRRKI